MGSKVRTSLECKLGLDIDALFQENSFKERILVSKHQALIGSGTMALLKSL
jgi:hypothetical protein